MTKGDVAHLSTLISIRFRLSYCNIVFARCRDSAFRCWLHLMHSSAFRESHCSCSYSHGTVRQRRVARSEGNGFGTSSATHAPPHLDGIVPQAWHYLFRIVLQTIDSLRGVTMAADARESKSTVVPVIIDALKGWHKEMWIKGLKYNIPMTWTYPKLYSSRIFMPNG